jgi:hypothetical protein
VLAVVAVLAWRLPADELAHPLDEPGAAERVGTPAQAQVSAGRR